MRASIVTEAAQDEKGQERGKKSREGKGETLLALLRGHVCTGRHNVWEKVWK